METEISENEPLKQLPHRQQLNPFLPAASTKLKEMSVINTFSGKMKLQQTNSE